MHELQKKFMSGASVEYRLSDVDRRLMNAIGDNDIDRINSSLADGANVNVRWAAAGTPLVFAGDNEAVVNLLLSHGANINQGDNEDRTALMRTAVHEDTKFMKFLLEHGAEVDVIEEYNNGWTALMLAAMRGKEKSVNFLLEHDADPNVRGFDGSTAIMLAAKHGEPEIVRLLLGVKGIDKTGFDDLDAESINLIERVEHLMSLPPLSDERMTAQFDAAKKRVHRDIDKKAEDAMSEISAMAAQYRKDFV